MTSNSKEIFTHHGVSYHILSKHHNKFLKTLHMCAANDSFFLLYIKTEHLRACIICIVRSLRMMMMMHVKIFALCTKKEYAHRFEQQDEFEFMNLVVTSNETLRYAHIIKKAIKNKSSQKLKLQYQNVIYINNGNRITSHKCLYDSMNTKIFFS